jgi:hypothetical protein
MDHLTLAGALRKLSALIHTSIHQDARPPADELNELIDRIANTTQEKPGYAGETRALLREKKALSTESLLARIRALNAIQNMLWRLDNEPPATLNAPNSLNKSRGSPVGRALSSLTSLQPYG